MITSYNQRSTLLTSVQSAIEQVRLFDRIVVVDDGSPETGALDEVRDLAGVEIVEQSNRGVSAARNAGVRLLDTDIVAVLDGDDAWEPGWAGAVEARFADPEVVAASSWLRTFGVADWVLRPSGGDITAFLARNNCSSSVAFRRSRWLACGGYDETMTAGFEDWDFALRLLGLGGRLDVVPRALIRYRTAPASDNMQAMARRVELYAAIIDRHAEVFVEHHRSALLALETIATERLNLGVELLQRHPDEDVQPLVTYGDGGMAAAVRVASSRAASTSSRTASTHSSSGSDPASTTRAASTGRS